MGYVVLDANVIAADFRLRSAPMQLLLRRSRTALDSVVVPEIVIQEASARHVEEFRTQALAIRQAHKKLRRLFNEDDLEDIEPFEGAWGGIEQPDDYETWLRDELAESLVEIRQPPEGILPDLVRRASGRIPPFDGQGHGFRDAAIWFTVLDLLNNLHPNAPVAFISADKDFRDGDALRPRLQADIETNDGPGLTLYKSVAEYVEAQVTDDIVVHNEVSEWVEDNQTLIENTVDNVIAGTVLDIYEAFGEGTIRGLSGDWEIAVEKVGAIGTDDRFLVGLTMTGLLEVTVDGYDTVADVHLLGDYSLQRTLDVSAVWDAGQEALSDISVGEVEDLHSALGQIL